MQIAALYFDKKVERWFHNQLVGRHTLTWDEFPRAIMIKYDRTDYGLVVGQFNKLRQSRNLESYVDQFEDLRATILEFNLALTEPHFLHSFVSGLHEEIRHGVMLFKP